MEPRDDPPWAELLTSVVLESSTAPAQCFPDETSSRADALLDGERQKRLRQPEVLHCLMLLESLPIIEDSQPASERARNL